MIIFKLSNISEIPGPTKKPSLINQEANYEEYDGQLNNNNQFGSAEVENDDEDEESDNYSRDKIKSNLVVTPSGAKDPGTGNKQSRVNNHNRNGGRVSRGACISTFKLWLLVTIVLVSHSSF